ncbi:hypothetical protein [Brevibacillus halotolerans]|uniref:hypothetical protein n=1 Tax=Brevibacillus halotolerans TaxID=1507437 RepID=UPI0015EFC298|nr:hypothetical protein [Brevibacillus halotolerans]MBA4535150.1 hypothetical protein [Brevibacillus halotolerans]
MSENFIINSKVSNYLNYDSLKRFLRPLPLNSTGVKHELIQRIESAIAEGQIAYEYFKNFLEQELRYGHNRTLFITGLRSSSLYKVRILNKLKESLEEAGLPNENFSIYTEKIPDTEVPELVHLKIDSVGSNVKKIELGFSAMLLINYTYEGEQLQTKDIDYVWIVIDVEKEQLVISVRPRGNVDVSSRASVASFEKYAQLLTEIFSIRYISNDDLKTTLYYIFKELTSKAEQPYVEKVNPFVQDIEDICKKISEEVGLPSSTKPVDLPFRFRRLIERALIQDDFFNFSSYSVDKIGRVKRYFYADDTGAKVNASSSEGDGIELNDIYFDTRETIDDQKTFNKLWITWFMPEGYPNKEVDTKLEVTEKYFTLHFFCYLSGDEEAHVLSTIEKFKQISN